MRRLAQAPTVLALLLVCGAAGAETGVPAAGAAARAVAVRIVLPVGEGAGTREVASPPDAVQYAGGFAYPDDGSIVSTGPVTASATSTSGSSAAAASGAVEIGSVVLFGGELTVETVTARATASAGDGAATGSSEGSGLVGLAVGGVSVEAVGGQIPLGDWGYADVLTTAEAATGGGRRGHVTALAVHVTLDHGGLPAGSEVLLGYAEASATAPPVPPPPPPAAEAPAARAEPPPPDVARERPAVVRTKVPAIVRRPLPSLVPRLTRRGYVFPVHGPASFVDTFGAGRAFVGWHHGEDIFAPLGAPVLAVAAGTVFSVGWNDVGGNRLWLRDREGNEFYYAHLSAFSPLAVDRTQVRAGDVLGFVGNSGDAETTPPHLHFEVHPVGLLPLGYDGVVNPYRYLLAWRRLEDVRFVAGATWLVSLSHASAAPTPGAFLLSSQDISTANGLDPPDLAGILGRRASTEAAGR